MRGVPKHLLPHFHIVEDYIEKIDENIEAGNGFVFAGPPGTLKTSLAVAIIQRALRKGHSGLFVVMASLVDTIFELKSRDKEEWQRFESRIKTAPLLILDDLGSENPEGWVQVKLDAIISERYNRVLPTIATSNLTPAQMEKQYTNRLYDRLASTMRIVPFVGNSLRGRK